jgi:hypothetical protein
VKEPAHVSNSGFKFGVFGAGAIAKGLIGRLPAKSRDLGPVAAVSLRVASRIANTLRAGYAVRNVDGLNVAPIILFQAPPDQAPALLEKLEEAEMEWAGKSLVFCDCDDAPAVRARLQARGASTASARQFGIPGRIATEGNGAALSAAHQIARELRLKALEILPGSTDAFDAAVTLGRSAITPLIDSAAALFRRAGIRDSEAARIAAALVQQTGSEYAHSGKQSWGWYIRRPELDRLEAQLAAAGEPLGPILRQLLVYGIQTFEKYPELGSELKNGGMPDEQEPRADARGSE